MAKKITLGTTEITQEVSENVLSCLDEGALGQGSFVREFEEKVEKMFRVKHAIATCNGTMADIVALAILKILKPWKRKVIVPAVTFIAQINSVFINGLEPEFVDIEKDGNFNLKQLEEKLDSEVLAIFPVHLLGRSAAVNYLKVLATRHDTYFLEDSCEAFGATLEPDKFLGTYGDMGTYSFFPSHVITTGEGGMIVTDNDEMAELARKLIVHGRRSDHYMEKFHFDHMGFNGKMSNLTAAIGVGVVDKTFEIVQKKQANVDKYNAFLDEKWWAQSPHAYPVWYESREKRDEVLKRLNDNGVEARKLFSCIPVEERMWSGEYPVGVDYTSRALYVPVHQNLTKEDIEYVCDLL